MKISVITATYNSAKTIGSAMNSLCGQSWRDIESIVVDGDSNDETLDVIRCHSPQCVRIISEPDLGIYDALNKGLRLATGEVVGFLHSDDEFVDDGVLADMAAIFMDDSVDVAYGDLDYISSESPSKVIRHWRAGRFTRSKLRRGWMPPHPAFFARRRVYARVGGFNLGFRIAADYDCLVRVLSREGIGVEYIPRVLVRMRVGGASNGSLGKLFRKSMEDLAIMRRHNLPSFALLAKNLSKVQQFWIAR